MTKQKKGIQKFLSSKKHFPVLAALASGLYPVFFYFTNNYTIVNTWGHVGYFVLNFLFIPVVVFVLFNKLFSLAPLKKWQKYVLPFLNLFSFSFFMTVCYYAGFHYKWIAMVFIGSVVYAIFFNKLYKKIVVFQLLLAIIGLVTLVPRLVKLSNYSYEWIQQPDSIEEVIFKKRPNIYFIQPDGYANFSELKNKNYNVDYSELENFLKKENFKYYNDFRSNYASTLSSNSATFMMKHHHYNNGTSFSEALNARNIIISDNTVLSIFKNNDYKTYFVTELPYLLLNKPNIGYDTSNFTLDDVSYIGTGLGEPQDIIEPLSSYISEKITQPKFFFIEIFNPGHIHGRKVDSEGIEGERKLWAENLDIANSILFKTITAIKEKDPNALIVIMADHGGFVGLEYTGQIYSKTQDRDIIYSIFTSTLAIHWPENKAPNFDGEFKSAVNVFRILFSYLGEDESYLQNLQPNESFVILKNEKPEGVYKYIDDSGKITLKKQ